MCDTVTRRSNCTLRSTTISDTGSRSLLTDGARIYTNGMTAIGKRHSDVRAETYRCRSIQTTIQTSRQRYERAYTIVRSSEGRHRHRRRCVVIRPAGGCGDDGGEHDDDDDYDDCGDNGNDDFSTIVFASPVANKSERWKCPTVL